MAIIERIIDIPDNYIHLVFGQFDEYLKKNGLTLEDLISILDLYQEELEEVNKSGILKNFEDAFNAESFKDSAKVLKELAISGELSPKTFTTTRAYIDLLKETGLTAEEAIEKINFGSRDNTLHPLAWDGSPTGGFSTSDQPWIAYHSRLKEVNLENDLASERSVFRFYQALLKLRAQTPAMLDGKFEVISKPEDEFFIYTRTLDGEQYAVICNFADEQEIKLPFACMAPVLANLNREQADGFYHAYECSGCKVKN